MNMSFDLSATTTAVKAAVQARDSARVAQLLDATPGTRCVEVVCQVGGCGTRYNGATLRAILERLPYGDNMDFASVAFSSCLVWGNLEGAMFLLEWEGPAEERLVFRGDVPPLLPVLQLFVPEEALVFLRALKTWRGRDGQRLAYKAVSEEVEVVGWTNAICESYAMAKRLDTRDAHVASLIFAIEWMLEDGANMTPVLKAIERAREDPLACVFAQEMRGIVQACQAWTVHRRAWVAAVVCS